ncbi:hypothetical protein [Anaeromyxobacter diazotrophicus]|uniref:Uncharacterized protein n=1 Tax=Anaeromyxobacter diazotrophicus TaxID=2590199 RepID=A0A7I9VKP7_9BACT|nr:hypothetical protein [Anaeromyxobacter diazotrophicus]GEJ56577.1 hypothetical protein AMYX_13180 [Anaeromyxobacter diazotrophicus]
MPDAPGLVSVGGGPHAGSVPAAKTLSALAALGCAVAAVRFLLLDDAHLHRVGLGWLIDAVVCAVVFASLVLRRGWSALQAEAVSLLLIGTTLVAQVHADWNSALSSVRFAPFEGFKIVALVVATVVPFRPAVAYALVGICAVMPVVLYALMPAQMRAELPIEAPWTTVIYPLIATGILVHRVRALRMEREMMRASAQREGLERFARVSLAYRDLTNSPLQVIELLRAELSRKHPESKVLLDHLQRSLGRLRGTGEMLSHAEHQVIWTSKEEGFDAAHVIDEYHRAAAR